MSAFPQRGSRSCRSGSRLGGRLGSLRRSASPSRLRRPIPLTYYGRLVGRRGNLLPYRPVCLRPVQNPGQAATYFYCPQSCARPADGSDGAGAYFDCPDNCPVCTLTAASYARLFPALPLDLQVYYCHYAQAYQAYFLMGPQNCPICTPASARPARLIASLYPGQGHCYPHCPHTCRVCAYFVTRYASFLRTLTGDLSQGNYCCPQGQCPYYFY